MRCHNRAGIDSLSVTACDLEGGWGKKKVQNLHEFSNI